MNGIQSIRINALDIFRALTMFLMLFVNDFAGNTGIPHWLHHAGVEEDMLGFSDTIFPAFLFAMGMAIPFAIQNRMKKGDSATQIVGHVFWRTVALLAMGVFTMNRDVIDASTTGMSRACYSLLMVLGFFLIWSVYPKVHAKWKCYIIRIVKCVGILLLAYLIYIYRGQYNQVFNTGWWGILGLIGWTYLVCSIVYLLVRDNLLLNTIVWGFLIVCSILSAEGMFADWPGMQYVPSDITLHAFGMAGVWISIVMQRIADAKNPKRFFILMGFMSIGMLIAGFVSHQYWIISKEQATPTWLFFCCAIFFVLFVFVYWLTDVKRKSKWFDMIKPAGTVTLTCYIIPYAWYSIESLIGVNYPKWMIWGYGGLVKSVIFSLCVIGVAWILSKMKIRLKV